VTLTLVVLALVVTPATLCHVLFDVLAVPRRWRQR
jgi:hypothetical protein